MMDQETEKKLWTFSEVDSIQKLEGFPFKNYSEFVNAVKSARASIGIEYGPARQLSGVSKSKIGEYFLLLLSWIPILVSVASVVIAFYSKNYWITLGIIFSMGGSFLASPYNKYHNIAYYLSIGALIYCVATMTQILLWQWISFSYAISFISVRSLNRIAWRWMRDAVLKYESLAAFLFKNENLHISVK